MDIKNLEPIAKIILGSGLIAILITEVLRHSRRHKLKKRLIKEVAFELFSNELIAGKIINDFQNLIQDPCGYLWSHKFKTHVMDPIISSAYFVNLNPDLVEFLFEFDNRFKKVQYELDRFFILEDDQKLHAKNLSHLKGGELDSRLLLGDLIKSKKLKEIKKKYYQKWIEQRIKRMEERYNKKIDKKKKRIIIKHEMKKMNK